MTNVLYLSYNGALEPLGQSQVLPYLRALAGNHGHSFWLISYEKPQHWRDQGRIQQHCSLLQQQGISWHPLAYHQRPTLPATLYDVLRGLPKAIRLVQRHKIEIVHVRSYVPMILGLALKQLLDTRLIFDMRGLWADERADGGQCTRTSLQYRSIKALERAGLRSADAVVLLTQRVKDELVQQSPLRDQPRPMSIIPCCVDLKRFRRNESARCRIRTQHGWQHSIVLVASGSLGGLYMTDELAKLYATWSQQQPTFHLLVLTQSNPDLIRRPLARYGIAEQRYTVKAIAPAAMPDWLSAADVALTLVRPSYSKIASSPTKQAEYLACGLPIVANTGIGDSDTLISTNNVGVLLATMTDDKFTRGLQQLTALLADPQLAQRCRLVATRELALTTGVSQYAEVYSAVLQIPREH